MSRNITTTVYKFDELSDSAKAKARGWYRQSSCDDSFWSEHILTDEAPTVLKAFGYSFVKIYYSGFSSQGDGACFVGNFYASDYDGKGTNALQALLVDRPTDTELARIAKELDALLVRNPELSASLEHRGRYYHEMSVSINVDFGEEPASNDDGEEAFIELSRDLMRWIYNSLEKAYDYANADEQIDENICANEYEFTEEGEPA